MANNPIKNADKLEFLPKFKEAGRIMIQSNMASAKMYPTTRDKLLALAEKGKISNLKTYFTPESIEAACKTVVSKPAEKTEKGK